MEVLVAKRLEGIRELNAVRNRMFMETKTKKVLGLISRAGLTNQCELLTKLA
tara:strand:+ start:405 stop:560 length:156 start_codon:yes stop_codon:yes gene_type:complete